MEIIIAIIILLLVNQFIYDKYVQRHSALLISYPVIGRMRYLFEILREPLRQYFAKEEFYESRDKIDWVYKASKDVPNFVSFSVSQPFKIARFLIKHANIVLNENEVKVPFSITIGENSENPYTSNSIIVRSAMSDGALSPEATRAFSMAAYQAKFPINSGEGGLTSNYFYYHKLNNSNRDCFEIYEGNSFQKWLYKTTEKIFNQSMATRFYAKAMLSGKETNTFVLDHDELSFFRPNWQAPLDKFPKEVPSDMADIIFQMSSALFGVRDKDGNFDEIRYQKVMSFCKMTEIKIAQGAKQTGGKLMANKVNEDIAYYRGVEKGKAVISPNRFPYANTLDELFDFVGKLQKLSKKPVGIKIVVSDANSIEEIVVLMKKRFENNNSIPDFISVDSGEGGSATAPLELMETIGLNTVNALYVMDTMLKKHNMREKIKIIISGKILTPDDIVIALSLGADMVGIARGFMMSGGCIRARQCSGTTGHPCPVGMATQDPKRRASYLVHHKAKHIANYHKNLLKGIKTLLAVMGVDEITKLSKKNLGFKNKIGEIYFNVDEYFQQKLHI